MARMEKKAPPEPKPIPGRGTPDGDTLREALKAFDAGDYAAVREITGRLTKAEDAAVRDAAADLAARVAVDPIQIVVLAACAAVLGTIISLWVL